MRLLSTKLLAASFKDRLIQNGFSLVEYPFITLKPVSPNFSQIESQLVFSSQNAVHLAFSNAALKSKLEGKQFFCVGEKTQALLVGLGQKVIKMCENSALLADFIVKNHKNDRFTFICGRLRRPEIEIALKHHQMALECIEIYETLLTPKTFENEFDGILFFSPSAVESYFKQNSWNPSTHGFCIGSTTASTLQKYTSHYSIAKAPNESQLLLSIHQYYTQHYAQK